MSPVDQNMSASDAAALWTFRHDVGLSKEDAEQFEAWLAASPDHAAAWAQAQVAWAAVDSEDDPFIDAMRVDALSARAPRRQVVSWQAAAAAVIVVAILGAVGWRMILPGFAGSPQGEIALNAAPTYGAQAVQRTVILPDGSQVTLAANAALALNFSSQQRELRLLQGRALFDVRHEGRPFAVQARDTVVTATGTRFDVVIQSSQVSTSLERGQVIVRRKGDALAVTLAPGQELVSAPGRPMRVSRIDPTIRLAWSEGYVEFHDTPLKTAVEEINRNSNLVIHVLGGAADLKVNGRFRIGDAKGFLAAIVEVLPVRQRPSRDGGIDLLLRPKS
jgi:transmembrane sensor